MSKSVTMTAHRACAVVLGAALSLSGCGGGNSYGGGGGGYGPPPAPTQYVFLTSTTYSGNITSGSATGIAAADAECNARATAAALPGTFVAWMSDSTHSASGRVANVTGGWMLPGTTTAAVGYRSELENLQTTAAVDRDENGTAFPSVPQNAWTGTGSGGTLANGACSDWTSSSGSLNGGTFQIGNGTGIGTSAAACSATARLLCLGQ